MSGFDGDQTEYPKPLKSISCQDLLTLKDFRHEGWLHQRTGKADALQSPAMAKVPFFKNQITKLSWDNKYVILRNGCLYTYKHDFSKLPNKVFSLYGYKRISRVIDETITSPSSWAFLLEPIFDDLKTIYFYTSSEQHMKKWMQSIHQEITEIAKMFDEKPEQVDLSDYGQIERPFFAKSNRTTLNKIQSISRKLNQVMDHEDEIRPVYVGKPEPPSTPSRRPVPVPGKKTSTDRDPSSSSFSDDSRKGATLKSGMAGTSPSPLNRVLPQPPPRSNDKGRPSSEQKRTNSHLVNRLEKIQEKDSERRPPQKPGREAKPSTLPKKPVPPTRPQRGSIPKRVSESDDADSDYCEDIWDKAVRLLDEGIAGHAAFDGPREEGIKVLEDIGEPGVFLIRNGRTGTNRIDKTLVVFSCPGDKPLNFKISVEEYEEENVLHYFIKTAKTFTSLVDLIEYYQTHQLPSGGLSMTSPYSYWADG